MLQNILLFTFSSIFLAGVGLITFFLGRCRTNNLCLKRNLLFRKGSAMDGVRQTNKQMALINRLNRHIIYRRCGSHFVGGPLANLKRPFFDNWCYFHMFFCLPDPHLWLPNAACYHLYRCTACRPNFWTDRRCLAGRFLSDSFFVPL